MTMTSEPNRILVVEDQGALRHVLAFNLEKAGFEVTLAQDPTKALQLAEREQFDLVITDYCMPYYAGTDFVRKLRENEAYAQTPVVLWTAKAEELSSEHLRDECSVELVSKSSSMADLLEVVSGCLAGSTGAR